MSEVTAHIALHEPDAEPEFLDELTRALRVELLELETPVPDVPDDEPDASHVSDVSLVPVETPTGARALDGNAVGELTMVLGSSAALLRTVIGVLRAWRERRPERTVDLKVGKERLYLADATPEQQDRAVEAFIAALREN